MPAYSGQHLVTPKNVMIRWFALALGALCMANGYAVDLPKATPESQGLDSDRLLRMLDYLQGNGFDTDSVLMARHGKLVLEAYVAPFKPGIAHQINSATKSFTSTLAGLAIAEGKLSLDDTVAKVLPQYADLPNARAITLRQLLGMQSGLLWGDDPKELAQIHIAQDAGRYVLQHARAPELVGKWNYNSGGSHLISLMVSRAVGMPFSDYAQQNLFTPLGFAPVEWDKDAQGHVNGSRGIYALPTDLMAFAELYRQHGQYAGQQLIPRAWVDYATAPLYPVTPDSPLDDFYGAQWWTTRNREWYVARGGGGQYIAVLPRYDISMVITSRRYAFKFAQEPDFNALVQYFIQPNTQDVLPDNAAALTKLNTRIAQLLHPAPQNPSHSPLEAELNGKLITLTEAGKPAGSFRFDFAPDQMTVSQTWQGTVPGQRQFVANIDGTWRQSDDPQAPLSFRAHWRDAKTLEVEQVVIRQGWPITYIFSFNGNHVHIDFKDVAAAWEGTLQTAALHPASHD